MAAAVNGLRRIVRKTGGSTSRDSITAVRLALDTHVNQIGQGQQECFG
jgi:hypothetical protein